MTALTYSGILDELLTGKKGNVTFLSAPSDPLGLSPVEYRTSSMPTTLITGASIPTATNKPVAPESETTGVPKINADSFAVGGNKADIYTPVMDTIPNPTNTTPDITFTSALDSGIKTSGTDTAVPSGGANTVKSNNNATETPVTAEPMSFEEYILSLKSKADDQYKRDILNAKNAYEQSKSAYGAQAAALGNMGLTGSGYSDYLDSKAYGQMQADKNAAARTREDTKLAADAQYMDYFNQQEANRTNAFTTLYSAIDQTTSEADIDALAKAYGLSEEQIASLKAARNSRVNAWLTENGYDKNTLDQLFPNGGAEYDAYYQKLKDKSEEVFKNTSAADFSGMTSAESQELIDEFKANGIDVTTLQKEKDKLYNVGLQADGGGVKYENTGSAFKPDKKGDNFKVVNTNSAGEKHAFKVENGGKVSEEDPDAAVLNVSNSVSDNQVFYYNGSLYLMYKSNVYRVVGRNNPEEYNALLSLFEKDF